MIPLRKTTLFALAACAAFLLAGCAREVGRDHLVYYLKKPLRVYTIPREQHGGKYYELPPGTALYLEGHQGGEAFERYKVYINVEGGLLEGKRTEHVGEIDPLHARLDSPQTLNRDPSHHVQMKVLLCEGR